MATKDHDYPTRWVICGCCEGEGRSSAHLGDFSSEQLAEDPDFAEAYFDGDYDRTCDECRGSGKVREVDIERLTPEQDAAFQIECEIAAERAAEARMRAQGYQF